MSKNIVVLLVILAIAFTTGLLVSLGKFAFASGFFTISFSILLIQSYLQVYARLKEESESSVNRHVYFLCSVSMVVNFVGVLFKVMHWPFAGPIFIISMTSVIICGIAVSGFYLVEKISDKKPSPIPYLFLLIPFLFFIVTSVTRMFLVENSLQETMANKMLARHADIELLITKQEDLNNMHNYFKDPNSLASTDTISQVYSTTLLLGDLLESIESRLEEMSGGRGENGELNGKTETTSVEIYLNGTVGSENGYAYKLEEKMIEYYSLIGQPFPFNKTNHSFVDHYFPRNTTLAESLLTLSQLRLTVLQLEQEYYINKMKNQDSQN